MHNLDRNKKKHLKWSHLNNTQICQNKNFKLFNFFIFFQLLMGTSGVCWTRVTMTLQWPQRDISQPLEVAGSSTSITPLSATSNLPRHQNSGWERSWPRETRFPKTCSSDCASCACGNCVSVLSLLTDAGSHSSGGLGGPTTRLTFNLWPVLPAKYRIRLY